MTPLAHKLLDSLHSLWQGILKHPYYDTAVLLVIITLSLGGVRWWGRPTVILTVDGITRKINPSGQTVRDALAENKVILGRNDFSVPSMDTPIKRSTAIQVTRVTFKNETSVERQKPKIYWRTQMKTNLRPILIERGFIHQSSQTVRVTYYNGVKMSQVVIKKKVTRIPVYQLTLFDRKTGRPSKVYDLAKAKMLSMRSTGYYVGEKYVPGDTTYIGIKLRRGLVAVDPKIIPLHTRLYVKGYGYAYAADTGSAIKNLRIDLAVKDKKEESKFNRHNVPVYILEKASSW